MTFVLEAAWAAGVVLALCRTAAFALASPIIGRALPPIGRVLFALAGAIFLARPVSGPLEEIGFVTAVISNVLVGLLLAFVTGLIVHLFDVAGEAVDLTSGLGAARILDPITRRDAGVFVRLFQMTSFAIFFVVGGDRLIMGALHRSTSAIPLDGSLAFDPGIGRAVLATVSAVMVAGLELAAPALAALVLAEVGLGVASRFAPQTNVFLLGLPAKLLITLIVLGAVLALFPGTVHSAIDAMLRSFSGLLRVLG